jgi:hypothetical protein
VCPGERLTPHPWVCPPVIQLVCPGNAAAPVNPVPLWIRDSLSPPSHQRCIQRSWWWEHHEYRTHYPLIQPLGGHVEPGAGPPTILPDEVVRYAHLQHHQGKDIQAAPTAVRCDYESGLRLRSAGHTGHTVTLSLGHVARSGVEPDCYLHLVCACSESLSHQSQIQWLPKSNTDDCLTDQKRNFRRDRDLF